MAQSLRRPFLGTVGLSSNFLRSSVPIQRRCATSKKPVRGQRPASQSEPSFRISQKQGQVMPSDIGMLPETFIMPTGAKRPAFYKSPFSSPFLEMQWTWLKLLLRDRGMMLGAWYTSPRIKGFFNRKIKLQRKKILPTAIALHKQMYTAFAEKDTKTLRKICSDGIHTSFMARMEARKKDEKWEWSIVKYNGRPRVVSNRMARLPIDGAALHQAVVKIKTKQQLRRWAGEKELAGSTEKDTVEYLVVQRKIWRWESSEWEVWGTTEESDWEDVKETWTMKMMG